MLKSAVAPIFVSLDFCEPTSHGQGRIRTSEGLRQQIYSLPPLTTWVPAQTNRLTVKGNDARIVCRHRLSFFHPNDNAQKQYRLPYRITSTTNFLYRSRRPDSNWRPAVYKTDTLPLSYTGNTDFVRDKLLYYPGISQHVF